MDNLATFKMEIEAMFEKSFQELSQKNNLNKAYFCTDSVYWAIWWKLQTNNPNG